MGRDTMDRHYGRRGLYGNLSGRGGRLLARSHGKSNGRNAHGPGRNHRTHVGTVCGQVTDRN
eukprot:scaffold83_cov181-Amphora_coffeaeformis.AAC.14